MVSNDRAKLVEVIQAMKRIKPSDTPEDHLHTTAMVCRIIGQGMSPLSENARVTIMSVVDVLDYVALEEAASDLDSPKVGTVTRMGAPIQPDTSVIDRLKRAGLPRNAAIALQSIAIIADYIDHFEVTSHIDLMDYLQGGGEPQ